jgi:hypothetical protein
MISTERLTDLFVEVADTLVADFDLIDFLHNLTDHASAISGAEAVGPMLADQHGRLRFMAASNEVGEMLELFQLQSSEGPCPDCFTFGQPVVDADLAGAGERWPLFAPAAEAAGFRSVHAFPMRLREERIGALDLFGRADVAFADHGVGREVDQPPAGRSRPRRRGQDRPSLIGRLTLVVPPSREEGDELPPTPNSCPGKSLTASVNCRSGLMGDSPQPAQVHCTRACCHDL